MTDQPASPDHPCGPRAMFARSGAARLWLAMMFVLFVGHTAAGQDDRWSLEVIGGWGGSVNTVDVDEVNQIAYVGAGQRLVVLDISNLADPQEMGSINLLTSVEDLKVRDGYAFVATGFEPYRFCVVDVRNPARPELTWFDPVRPPALNGCRPGDSPREVDLFGDVAFVRDNSDNVRSYDIGDPSDVQPLAYQFGLCFGPPWEIVAGPKELEIVGDLLYMVTRQDTVGFDAALRIYDLSANPVAPTLAGSIQFGVNDEATHLAVEGDYAYVTVNNSVDRVLHVIDISQPASLSSLGTVAVGVSEKIAVRDAFVFVPSGTGTSPGFRIVDATVPTAPVVVGTFATRGPPEGVSVFGSTGYVLDPGEGLLALDLLPNPAAPSRIGHYHSPGGLRQIAKQGDLLFISDYWNGFSVVNVADPDRPLFIGAYQTSFQPAGPAIDGAHGIGVIGSLAYLTVGPGGLEEVDISNPEAPSMTRAFRDVPSTNTMQGLALSSAAPGQITAHVGLSRLMYSIDVTANPMVLLGDVDTPGSSTAMGVTLDHTGEVAFLSRDSTLVSIDVQDPASASVLFSGMPRPATNIALDGTTAFMTSFDSNGVDPGLHVLDVSRPATPAPLSSIDGLPQAYGVGAQSGRLYVSALNMSPTGEGFVRLMNVFDVTDPLSPALLAFTWGPGSGGSATFVEDICVEEPHVYLVGGRTGGVGNTGLVIFESRCSPDCDSSGVLDIFDFICFQDAFVSMDPSADCDGSGVFDIFDFICFQDEFALGCP